MAAVCYYERPGVVAIREKILPGKEVNVGEHDWVRSNEKVIFLKGGKRVTLERRKTGGR